MDGLHRFSGTIGLRLTPVHDQVKGAQRSQQPPPQVAPIVQVIDEAGSDKWMGYLQQHGRATTQQGDERRSADPADDAVRREVAIPCSPSVPRASDNLRRLVPASLSSPYA